jgi:hypothetical protein
MSVLTFHWNLISHRQCLFSIVNSSRWHCFKCRRNGNEIGSVAVALGDMMKLGSPSVHSVLAIQTNKPAKTFFSIGPVLIIQNQAAPFCKVMCLFTALCRTPTGLAMHNPCQILAPIPIAEIKEILLQTFLGKLSWSACSEIAELSADASADGVTSVAMQYYYRLVFWHPRDADTLLVHKNAHRRLMPTIS